MNSPGRIACAVLVAIFCSGCVSARYKPAKKTTPPAVAMNMTASQPPLEAAVNTVIVFQGPGSWKKYAMWDEYVVTVTNRGDGPITLVGATLVGAVHSVVPHAEPWQLEKTSRLAQRDGFGMGNDTVVQLGQGITGFLVVSGTGALLGATSGGFITGAAAAGMGAAAATVVALPVFIGGTIYRNVSNRHDIEREFNRRRMALPMVLNPQQTSEGSLFFPITPAPRHLTLHFPAAQPANEITVELTPLQHLHLKPGATPAMNSRPPATPPISAAAGTLATPVPLAP